MTSDEAFVAAIKTDWRAATLSARERAICEYAEMITLDATRVTPATLDGLRAIGFDDRGITQIAVIASFFNYINRMADALGVGRPDAGSGG
ncbi:MAG TPA: hypothetical protein VG916_10425 [Gemmatimonadaceae bacterium]|nr:hypothetical protein [Gemmatimonadaceae bacterium]